MRHRRYRNKSRRESQDTLRDFVMFAICEFVFIFSLGLFFFSK